MHLAMRAQLHLPALRLFWALQQILLIIIIIIIIIIKRISRAPVYHTRWQHRALYNNTNHTHTHARTHARTHAFLSLIHI